MSTQGNDFHTNLRSLLDSKQYEEAVNLIRGLPDLGAQVHAFCRDVSTYTLVKIMDQGVTIITHPNKEEARRLNIEARKSKSKSRWISTIPKGTEKTDLDEELDYKCLEMIMEEVLPPDNPLMVYLKELRSITDNTKYGIQTSSPE